ncbi:hypothetical protein B0H11DRAFT_2215501 [Mycena galericulata]|nr:hypothetical protein B0H11DRAFT_2215501 [Mycena galericulata]
MYRLAGSTENNPWVLRDDGSLVLERGRPDQRREREQRRVLERSNTHANAAAATEVLRINRGPPSTIPRSLSGGSAASAPAVGPSVVRTTTSVRAARVTTTPLRRIVPRITYPRHVAEALPAERKFLMMRDLYLDELRPPDIEDFKVQHRCGICFELKSHPVSYKCGHSHCYVCIRKWFEKRGTCPECKTMVDCAPFRHWGEEAGIIADYPEHIIMPSGDGRRVNTISEGVSTTPEVPAYYQDDAATNAAVESEDFSYDLHPCL